MFKKLTIENFLSFDEKQTIDFTSIDNINQNTYCIIGRNSSGKTNVIKALDFLKKFITNSFLANPEGIIEAVNNKFSSSTKTSIEVEFFIMDALYSYKLDIDKIVLYEELKKDNKVLFRIINEVQSVNTSSENGKDKTSYRVNRNSVADPSIMDKKEIDTIMPMIRPNASFLSTLPQINKDYFLDVYQYFNRVEVYDNTHSTIDQLFHEKDFASFITDIEHKQNILEILQSVDKDIDDIQTITKKVPEKKFHFKLDSGNPVFETLSTEDDEKEIAELKFHKNGVEFQYQEQSHGVLKLLQVLHKLLPIIHNGGVLIVDEIENGLHPRIYNKILNLFNSSENAQLIFTTHNLIFLDDMRKDQISIVEKYENKSYIKNLRTLQPEKDVYFNFLREYMTGKYDTTFKEDNPDFDWLDG